VIPGLTDPRVIHCSSDGKDEQSVPYACRRDSAVRRRHVHTPSSSHRAPRIWASLNGIAEEAVSNAYYCTPLFWARSSQSSFGTVTANGSEVKSRSGATV
jgi:hypothetical protein